MDKKPDLIRYNIFEPFTNLCAFTTTKSTLPIENIRYSNVPENKAKLANALALEVGQMVYPDQTHSSCVVDVNEVPDKVISETDALVTSQSELCLCVQTADCVPVLLFDPEAKVVAAIHAGWRGTVGGIVEKALVKMTNYGASTENIVAAIGPSISSEIYEVGDEVVNAARESIPNVELTLRKNGTGKTHFNLWEANRQLLLKNGVPAQNIEVLGACSFSEDEKYYSARRDGVNTGRMVSGIMLKPQTRVNKA
ncbi:peptidoglycan editing factor PgeF [Draconibacterium sp. IB214405]|uniref:peptidoglycan editing factor PgeF n=1 Tax=Draconibacterium sp. IB214405 TaxID=3097352 RepID=UPI002A0B7B20|nr:peptidoglycan editing factor PgeF [Draconibacterium sp. IB214405]MDX8337706.1 peptidoglycan editing factor PgeF [Draconibacterium sp. IB214405]